MSLEPGRIRCVYWRDTWCVQKSNACVRDLPFFIKWQRRIVRLSMRCILYDSAPHYHVVAKKIEAGIGTPLVNYLRTILIESIYRRLGQCFVFCPPMINLHLFVATMFPETANWLTSADEYVIITCENLLSILTIFTRRIIHVGINAIIWSTS